LLHEKPHGHNGGLINIPRLCTEKIHWNLTSRITLLESHLLQILCKALYLSKRVHNALKDPWISWGLQHHKNTFWILPNLSLRRRQDRTYKPSQSTQCQAIRTSLDVHLNQLSLPRAKHRRAGFSLTATFPCTRRSPPNSPKRIRPEHEDEDIQPCEDQSCHRHTLQAR
jgi:hypothetical protein